MTDHKIETMSESEEMYLITIARFVEQGGNDPMPIPRLAEQLAIQPVSTNQMIHKLAEDGLVNYIPYKGVELTPEGNLVAAQVLRDRRLWEVFLVDHLNLSAGEADALACRLEHITPKNVVWQLAQYLEHPTVGPQGLPIPEFNGVTVQEQTMPLSDLSMGQRGEVRFIEAEDPARDFLIEEGFFPGADVQLLAVGSRGAMLVKAGENQLRLASEIAAKVRIRLKSD